MWKLLSHLNKMKLNAWQLAIAKGANPPLYPWQIKFLEAFSRGYPCLAVTPNGAGKTSVLAGHAVDWFFTKYPQGWLIATSSSFNQLQNQTWPSITTKLSNGYEITRGSSPLKIKTPYHQRTKDCVGGEAIGFATNDANRAEGWHPKINPSVDPVMLLIDEGKTVPDDIWTAFDRCTNQYFMGVSSAGPPMGRFFEGFHSLKKYYWTIQVDYTMCPHIKKEDVDKMRDIYGEDSYEFRSIMLGQFTDSGEDFILSKMQLQEALKFQPAIDTSGERVAFFDFARGGDENVFAYRQGNKIRIIESWRDRNTVQAVRKFIHLAKELGLHAGECWGDADGLGGPMVDQFHDQGFRINEFHGGAKAMDENYTNIISQAWIEGARRIQRGDFNLGELDPETKKQITNRKFEWNDKGKKRTERKEDMAKRGVKSPDRGDGIMCVAICGSYMSKALTDSAIDGITISNNRFKTKVTKF